MQQQQKQRQSLEKHMQPDSVSSKIGTKKLILKARDWLPLRSSSKFQELKGTLWRAFKCHSYSFECSTEIFHSQKFIMPYTHGVHIFMCMLYVNIFKCSVLIITSPLLLQMVPFCLYKASNLIHAVNWLAVANSEDNSEIPS